MHTFARFLFTALLTYDIDLAYQVGLRAMRLPILEGFNNFYEDLNNNSLLQNNNHHRLNYSNFYLPNNSFVYPLINNHYQAAIHQQINRSHDHHHRSNGRHGQAIGQHGGHSSWHRWHVLNTIEQQQCLLATTMIYAAKNDLSRLKDVQKAAQKHIHTFTYLFLLAQETFKIAVPIENSTAGQTNSVNSNSTGGGSNASSISNHHHLHGGHQQLSYLNQRLNGSSNPLTGSALNHAYNPLLSNLSSLAFPGTPSFPFAPHNGLTAYGHSFKPNTVSHLLEVAFELGLQVTKMTSSMNDNKRKEIVKWIVNCALEMGFVGLCYLMQFWEGLFTAFEAVKEVACVIMSSNVLGKINLTTPEQESLWVAAKELAVRCTRADPPNCALHAMPLCENDRRSFEKCYEVVVDAAINRKMPFNELMKVIKHIEQRGRPEWAFKLGQLAMKMITIAYNQETQNSIGEIHWICSLAYSLGKEQLSKLVPILIENIACAQVLSDILRRCSSGGSLGYPLHNTNANQQPAPQGHHQSANQFAAYPYLGLNGNSFALNGAGHVDRISSHQYSHSRRHHPYGHHSKMLSLDKDPLKSLLDAAIQAYVKSTHMKLQVISPRHYSDFVEFLAKAKETFLLASDGESKFNQLIDTIRTSYKGKKKLLNNILIKFQQIS